MWHAFKPLQPSGINTTSIGLAYSEYTPCEALSCYIHCCWLLTGLDPAAIYSYPVIADGSVDIIIDLNSRGEVLLSVTSDQAFCISLQGSFQYLGIRFFPACIHYFYDLSLEGLTSLTLPVREIASSLNNEFTDICATNNFVSSQIKHLEVFLVNRLFSRKATIDRRFQRSLAHILQSSGNAPIEAKVADLVSPRHMRRLFEQYTSLSPKNFSRIVRFQQTLNKMLVTPKKQWRHLCYDQGYFDQPHFLREFKVLYGKTPSQLRSPADSDKVL